MAHTDLGLEVQKKFAAALPEAVVEKQPKLEGRPKIKTHSGAKKRFKLTKNGKVKRGHAFRSHLLNGHGKTRKLKRAYRKASYADKTNTAVIKRMLPYA